MALHIDQKPLIEQGWLRAVFCLGVYMVGGLLAMRLAGLEIDAGQGPIATPLLLRVLLINALLCILIVVGFRKLVDGRSLKSLGLSWHGWEALTGAWVGAAIIGGGSLVLFLAGYLRFTGATYAPGPLWAVIGLLLVTSFSEEWLFRGYLLSNLLDSLGEWKALLISSALFAGMHMGNDHISVVALINLFAGGLLLGLNYCYTRNCWYSIALHSCWNILQGPVLGYEVSGIGLPGLLQQERQGPTLLTGGAFGLEGSLINTLLSVALLLLLYRVFGKRYGRSLISFS